MPGGIGIGMGMLPAPIVIAEDAGASPWRPLPVSEGIPVIGGTSRRPLPLARRREARGHPARLRAPEAQPVSIVPRERPAR